MESPLNTFSAKTNWNIPAISLFCSPERGKCKMRKITFYKCGHKRMGIASLSVPNFINLRHYCSPLKSVNTGDIRTYLHTVSHYFYNHHQAFLQFLFENVGIIPTLIPSGFYQRGAF